MSRGTTSCTFVYKHLELVSKKGKKKHVLEKIAQNLAELIKNCIPQIHSSTKPKQAEILLHVSGRRALLTHLFILSSLQALRVCESWKCMKQVRSGRPQESWTTGYSCQFFPSPGEKPGTEAFPYSFCARRAAVMSYMPHQTTISVVLTNLLVARLCLVLFRLCLAH